MSEKVNPYTLLREVVELVLENIADEINSTRGTEGYVARTGSSSPYSNPKRPILDARSISLYRAGHHQTTVSAFRISDSDVLLIQDIRVILGATRIN